MEKSKRNLWIGIGVVIAVVVIVALIGVVALRPEPEVLMGEVVANEYRVANKVPGRLDTLYVEESSQVRVGDTLAYISSPEVDAKLTQAKGRPHRRVRAEQQGQQRCPSAADRLRLRDVAEGAGWRRYCQEVLRPRAGSVRQESGFRAETR